MSSRILVTGATRGLGESIARLLDQLGHSTLLLGRSGHALEKLQQELNHARVLACDLTQTDQVPAIVDHALEQLGGLDGLINNAGTIEPIASMRMIKAQAWTDAIALNLTAPALLMQACLPQLSLAHGRIVNISSGAAIKPMAGWGAYCASKAGLLHLSAVIASEEPQVGCFSLRPGVIDTDMQHQIRQSHDGMHAGDRERFLALHSEGKLLPAQVPARAACWLVLRGPLTRSGTLIEHTDPEVLAGIDSLFAAST